MSILLARLCNLVPSLLGLHFFSSVTVTYPFGDAMAACWPEPLFVWHTRRRGFCIRSIWSTSEYWYL